MHPATFATHGKFQAKGYKIGNGGMALLITGFLLLFLYGTGNLAQFGLKPGAIVGGTGLTCANNYSITASGFQCGSQLTASASVQDPLLGSGVNSATVALFNGQTQVDTATTASTGLGAFGVSSTYVTGQSYIAKITATNYVTEFLPVTIPPVPTSSTPATSVTIPMYDVKTGTYSFTFVGTGGTTFSTGQTYIWASTGLTSITLSMTITETVSNNGYKSTYDMINGIMDNMVLEISDGGGASSNSQYMTLQGPQFTSKQGTTNYWQYILPDGIAPQVTGPNQPAFPTNNLGQYALAGQAVSSTSTSGPLGSLSGSSTQQLIGTSTYGGSISSPINVQKGNLATGNSITLSFKIYTLYDPNYFLKTGVGSPASGQPTQLGSTYTIVFKG